MWVFPVIVMVSVVVLTVLGISGTSTPRLGGPDYRDGVIAGTPRAIRSDEWLVRTPLVVGQVERGFPRLAEVGVGAHDMSVLSDLPVANWAEVFHPQHVAYFVLPVEQAFAFEWWTTSALLLLGAYALLLVLLRDWRWSAVGAVVLWGSPFFHWWYYPAMLGTASWALLAVASFLSSLNPEISGWARWWRVGFAGYSTACFALILYPPVQIPIVFVALAVTVGWCVQRRRFGVLELRRVLLNLALIAAFVGLVLVAFTVTRREALRAISNSLYPGDRRVSGGGGGWGLLVDGWFGWSFISDDEGMRPVLGNESEASSFLLLGLFALAAVPFLWRDLTRRFREIRGVLVALTAITAVVAIHIFIGWGKVLSTVTLLDRVTAQRAMLGLGVASTLLLVLLAFLVSRSTISRDRQVLATIAVLIVGGAGIIAFGAVESAKGVPIDVGSTIAALLMFVIPAAMLFWRPLVALAVLALVGVSLSVPANPLVKGLHPLTRSVFIDDVGDITVTDTSGGWLTNDEGVASLLTAAGVDSVSMTNLYPNESAWRILDPSGANAYVWNRYEHVYWVFDDSVVDPVFTLIRDEFVAEVRIAPCDARLTELGVRHIVSWMPLSSRCLVLDRESMQPNGKPLYIYSRPAGPS